MWSNAAAALSIPGALLAHQGGWDEILLVAGPMVFVAFLLWVAKRRVTRRADETGDDQEDGTRSMAAPTSRRRPTRSS